MAEKEIEGLKKKLADTDTKLKAVMADKQALSQVGLKGMTAACSTCSMLYGTGAAAHHRFLAHQQYPAWSRWRHALTWRHH
jgi:hypothetical protein